jgi:hypothetical protein
LGLAEAGVVQAHNRDVGLDVVIGMVLETANGEVLVAVAVVCGEGVGCKRTIYLLHINLVVAFTVLEGDDDVIPFVFLWIGSKWGKCKTEVSECIDLG